MLKFKNIEENEIEKIIETKEVTDNIKNEDKNVITIFTQDWCGDWKNLEKELKANENTDIDITVFICIYNKIKLYEEFMSFKENIWGNELIPYLRYYKDGKFLKDTNHLPFQRIRRIFE